MIVLVMVIVAAVLLAIDLITKAVFVGDGFTLIPKVLSIQPIRNYGAAFGILQNARIFLIIITFILLVIGIIFYIKFKQGKKSKFYNIGCGFVLAGALGNLFDRLFLGYVRDFISFDFINFPVLNLADAFLNVGMVLLAIYFIFMLKGKKSEKNQS